MPYLRLQKFTWLHGIQNSITLQDLYVSLEPCHFHYTKSEWDDNGTNHRAKNSHLGMSEDGFM